MTAILLLIEIVAAVVIAVQSVIHVNRMSRCTRRMHFIAWVMLGGAAAAIVASLVTRHAAPEGYESLMLVAVAMLVSADRRRGSR